jgi:glycosyltransferase involved in cell wall biosynthesis
MAGSFAGRTVLSIAYPLAPVTPDTAGGAEQVLALLDAAIVAAGGRSLVIAPAGSVVAGTLLPLPAVAPALDAAARASAQAAVRQAIGRAGPVDLVHLHGIDFMDYLPPPGPAVLATLHLPPEWYPPAVFAPARPRTWLNCVSATQHAACPPSTCLLPPVPNGVRVAALGPTRHARRGFALMLGRICPEKGQHLAIAAARWAGVPLLIGGTTFGYPEHLAYFEREVAPHAGRGVRLLGPVGFARKRRLLAAARCVLLPSLAAETSSLVAMEAAAAGTPAIGFRAGALPEIIEQGRTGFLVDDAAAMAAAIAKVGAAAGEIDRDTCQAVARRRFDAAAMTGAYLALYRRLIG